MTKKIIFCHRLKNAEKINFKRHKTFIQRTKKKANET